MAGTYFGSPSYLTSTANVELIQQHKPSGWTTTIEAYRFEFKNVGACTIKINGGSAIYFEENSDFIIDDGDIPIYSFVIVESGIKYKYFGAYR